MRVRLQSDVVRLRPCVLWRSVKVTNIEPKCVGKAKERRVFEFPDVKFPNVSHGCHYTHKGETLFKHTSHLLGFSLNYESIKSAPRRQQTHIYRTLAHNCISQFHVEFVRWLVPCILHIYNIYIFMCNIKHMQIWHLELQFIT